MSKLISQPEFPDVRTVSKLVSQLEFPDVHTVSKLVRIFRYTCIYSEQIGQSARIPGCTSVTHKGIYAIYIKTHTYTPTNT